MLFLSFITFDSRTPTKVFQFLHICKLYWILPIHTLMTLTLSIGGRRKMTDLVRVERWIQWVEAKDYPFIHSHSCLQISFPQWLLSSFPTKCQRIYDLKSCPHFHFHSMDPSLHSNKVCLSLPLSLSLCLSPVNKTLLFVIRCFEFCWFDLFGGTVSDQESVSTLMLVVTIVTIHHHHHCIT